MWLPCGVDALGLVATSTVVAAIIGAIAGYVSQRALAGRQARLSYEYNARQRLYEAVGPLRFQLLMACHDVVRRVSGHPLDRTRSIDPMQYYGSSTLFRLLRPLAVCILVQRRMNASDFSVDPSSVKLLQFEVGAYRMLTSSDPLPYHSALDWANETQHVFRDNLRRAAVSLIATDGDGRSYVIDYAEFLTRFPDPCADAALAPLADIMREAHSSMTANPVFWVRVVGYAYLCQKFLEANGEDLGFSHREMVVPALLAAADDADIQSNAAGQQRIFDTITDEGL